MSSEELTMQGDMEGGIGSSPQEEKIFVSIRVRPLNEKEISRNDVSYWECINNTSIIFKHTLPDRAMFPAAYTFELTFFFFFILPLATNALETDRVFGVDTPTKQVYDEGARVVALSAVGASIFAYGQTSSGKTYTMTGITECAVADMYNYIDMHKERQYLLKFSAMEIYNEAVRDLLSSDSGPLRLLDDPEKGTVVERLTEVTLKDWSHLKELLSICEAERKIGETSLNETSSRSHQIMRLNYLQELTFFFLFILPLATNALETDRVFGVDTPTKQVYEEGARVVALSAVGASIFAYGQTSSGKTYTMTGITECAVADMYNYIDMHKERQYLLKFSAMEIYNEAVRDLLSSDSGPLRLLDDPEKGTVVERLTEVTLKDWSHLKELLSICEAERKIGETSLNETSSRSHQIMRLTIESTAREYRGMENSSTLAAQVNFVDLAGSERASQTLSVGTRLKEGSHINRSLLTLGTVIRKLSKGRNGHVPYRDSKLTRILQNSLGGNARTAIICTMSPARSHVEQSRNTLLFASCAKEVTTNAQVNVMMSDKAMVKQLQRELARLENELKSLVSGSITYDFAALLKEKDLMIEKMDQEVNELKQQLDLAQSQVENRQQSDGEDRILRIHDYSVLESLNLVNPPHLNLSPRTSNMPRDFDETNMLNSSQNYQQIPEDNFLLDSTPKFVGPVPYKVWEEIAQRADAESEDSCKEVRCIEVEESQMDEKIEATPSLHGPKEIAGQFPLQEVMKEDAVTSPQEGVKRL
ncbi:kinesin-like protein kin-7i [Quercus suber]|uniref:Kinesin-like protein n=1 Tax=Quercus suber TaxID=58331 RepID=A0AAW0MA71_QUESU